MSARAEVTTVFDNYANRINNIEVDIWNGTSKDHLTSMASSFVGEYKNPILTQLSQLESAISNYAKWQVAKQNYERARSAYNSCSGDTEESRSRRSYYARLMRQYKAEMEQLAKAINSALESIKGARIKSQANFVQYYQYNYKDAGYGYGTTIAEAGCGPTAMAMVISTLTDKEVTPVDAANWSLDHGFRCYGNGTYWSYFDAYAKENGLECTQSTINADSITSNLKDGNPVIVSVGPGTFTKNGHFVVLTGMTDDGQVTIADPNSEEKSSKTYDLNVFLNEGTQQWVIK